MVPCLHYPVKSTNRLIDRRAHSPIVTHAQGFARWGRSAQGSKERARQAAAATDRRPKHNMAPNARGSNGDGAAAGEADTVPLKSRKPEGACVWVGVAVCASGLCVVGRGRLEPT